MSVSTSNGAATFENEQAAWTVIPLAHRTPMQGWAWTQACFETHYRDASPVFVIANDQSVPCAAMAFAKRGWLAPQLFLVGAEENGEPVDALYKDAASAAALAEKVCGLGRAIRFGHFPKHSLFYEAFAAMAGRKGILLSAPVNGSPYITLDEGWCEPLSKFSSSRRSDLRRMMRKSEKMGTVSFEVLEPHPESVDRLLDEAIAVEAKSWKSRSKTAIADNETQAAFYRNYARLAAAAGTFRISHMKIDGQLVAMQLAVDYDDSFWLFKIGYDEAFGACSPGNLLMLETIKHAAEKGLSTFEFLGKAADWTKVWTETERPNIALRYYPHSLSGYFCLARDAIGVAAHRMQERLDTLTSKNKNGK